jgi:protein-S-isoprenylcysteine O-methyltransferase Ste14
MTRSDRNVIETYGNYAIAVFAVAIGGSSLVATGLFLLCGPLFPINLGVGLTAGLTVNTLLSLLFFAQHSGMVRPSVRDRLPILNSKKYYAAAYAISSGICLWGLILFWQPSGVIFYSFDGAPRLMIRLLFLVSIAIFVWGNKTLGLIDTLGVKAVLRKEASTNIPKQTDIAVRGPYRFIRHPLYLASLLMIWSFPDLTADRLLFNILWSIWIVVGARMEERDLVAIYGKSYSDYQQQVPMLIPFLRK